MISAIDDLRSSATLCPSLQSFSASLKGLTTEHGRDSKISLGVRKYGLRSTKSGWGCMGHRSAGRVYERVLRPLLFLLDPETAHHLAQRVLQREFPWSLASPRNDNGRLAVKIGEW